MVLLLQLMSRPPDVPGWVDLAARLIDAFPQSLARCLSVLPSPMLLWGRGQPKPGPVLSCGFLSTLATGS